MTKRMKVVALLVTAALAGCSPQNPMGPAPGGAMTNGTSYQAIKEVLTSDVLFSPSLNSPTVGWNTTVSPAFGGPIQYSLGGSSAVYLGPTVPGTYTPSGGNLQSTTIALGSPGIGGVNGDYVNDHYIRWAGFKGPDASADFSSMSFFFKGSAVDYSLSGHGYRGFIFFARGIGNFSVSIAGGNGPAGPYGLGAFNFYSKVFGGELAGPTQWKQITVLFSEMTQLYGQAADLNTVLGKATGLEFSQEAPISSNFQLDVDYIRFFK